MNDIFSGIKILDLTKVFSGPFCTRNFADYGAEVIKIETPQVSDDSRQYPPLKNGHSGYYEVLNRNKKGVSINLKLPSDLQKFYQLCATADVIVENFTPKTKFDLKIDYQTICQYKKDIIYASLSGLGQKENRKYYDVLAQAESGLMSLSGTPGQPMKIGPSVVDAFSGLTLAFGISGALLFRARTGKGQYLDVSMLGSSMQLLESNLTEASITQKNPLPTGNQDNQISPFGIYKTKDGYIGLAVGNNTQWQALLGYLKKTESVPEELFSTNALRLENAGQLTVLIEKRLRDSTSQELVPIFQSLNIGCAPVNSMNDLLQNEQLLALGDLLKLSHPDLGTYVVPGRNIRFSAAPLHHDSAAPNVGQDNETYGI